MTRGKVVAGALAALGAAVLFAQVPSRTPAAFAGRIAALSEPGGYFDTDNLISNERSYLHVVPALREPGRQGGAYLGVGPDQNFSYIAHVRPSIAIIVDIRRDNMLLHLLFKALFELAPTRVEYLALLTGRASPTPTGDWRTKPIASLVSYVDGARAPTAAETTSLAARVTATITRFGVPLSAADRQTIARFHRRFIDAGLSLQFNSAGRAPQSDYPTYRDLLVETDLAGVERSFLAVEDDYQFVRSLQAKDLVIPIVGDLAGTTALAAAGRFLAERGETVSAFYASNVEFYLFRQGTFGRFVANLERLPSRASGVIVRSAFGGVATAPGYNSASMTQPIRSLVTGYARGEFRRYGELLAWRSRIAYQARDHHLLAGSLTTSAGHR